MKTFGFRNCRIALWLVLLGYVAVGTLEQRLASTAWRQPLLISIFPVNGDGSRTTADYISGLADSNFAEIDEFILREARRYDVAVSQPTTTRVGTSVEMRPPVPDDPQPGVFASVVASLELRWWAYWHTPDALSNVRRVRMFVVFAAEPHEHSLGLREGLIGVVHAFTGPQHTAQNNVIIAHELLHTLGASDKYDVNGLPLFPHGFWETDRSPRFPQTRAEIMAGRVPVNPWHARIPRSLEECVVGPRTAFEINWVDEDYTVFNREA